MSAVSGGAATKRRETISPGRASELARWVIRVDRRLITLRHFKHTQFAGAADIAKETERSTQNVSMGLKEMEGRGLVKQLEPGRRTWKKYTLTSEGKQVLETVEKELSTGLFERLADELSFRYVRDAYMLVVTEPIVVTRDMRLHEVVSKVLADPKTRSAYVVDKKRRLIGMIALKQMLTAVEGMLSLFDKARMTPRARRAALPFSVEEYMFRPETVSPDDRLIGALQKMMSSGLEDLPVVDENGILVGELNGFEILLHGADLMRNQEKGRG